MVSKNSSCVKQVIEKHGEGINANMKKSESHKPKACKKTKVESLYETSEAQFSVLQRAEEVAASLAPEFPHLIRIMLPSHVTRVFWLGLPKAFCSAHMPKNDTVIVLEDESGEEFETKYLVEKDGLSGGWRGFSIAHKLREGDVIVFHLVTPSKFKVYIVRSNGSDGMDCTLSLIKLDDGIRQIDTADATACESSHNEKLEPISVENPHENVLKENSITCKSESPQPNHSTNESGDFDSEVLDGISLSESVIPFKEVSCIEKFSVAANGLITNSEISKYHYLTRYYELCRSQNSFLHDHILEGLNCNLVAGIISETVNIADAIRACKITTSECSFSTWDKTLEGSEMLGMNVGFLRARLNGLASLASQSKRFKEAKLERDQAIKGLRTMEAKILAAKEIIDRLGSEVETLKMNSEKLEAMFEEMAKAPW